MVFKLSEGFRLIEVRVMVFDNIDLNEQRAAKTRQGIACCVVILKEKKSVSPDFKAFDLFKPYSGTCVVHLYSWTLEMVIPYYHPSTVQEEVPPS